MSRKNENGPYFASYLKYRNLEDMLKIIVYAAQSPIGLTPMLYHIRHNNHEILFIESGSLNPVVHYIADNIGSDTQSLYVPILELEKCTFDFPL